MKNFVNNWQKISLLLGILIGVCSFFVEDILQKLFLFSIAVYFLHFFEEFGFPGGFPAMGVRVLLNSREKDSTKWNCNNLNSMFGNWGFLFLVYFLPMIFPDVKFLTLSAMLFIFAELFMHLILFNVKLKRFYNPGMITGVFGLTPIGVYYFANVCEVNFYGFGDYISAIVWFVAVFWFSFRSPPYWSLGKKFGYKLTRQSAYQNAPKSP